MVIVEVAMPSGFLIEKDRLNDLLRKQHVKLIETRRGETVVDIYFDQMLPSEEICFEVQGYRSHNVAENKQVPVRIYDYYDSCEYLNTEIFLKYNEFIQICVSLQLEVHENSMKFRTSHHAISVRETNVRNHANFNSFLFF